VKILIIDHLFGQDIEALLQAQHGHEVLVMSFETIANAAHQIFPDEVFCGLAVYHEPRFAEHRKHWTAVSREILHALRRQFPYECLVAPSDTIFYLRDLMAHGQAEGIPTIVLQKETTISPWTMDTFALDVKRYYPSIAELMVVCSERHKEFWNRTGRNPTTTTVRGQPRFDHYRHPERWKNLESMGIRVDRSKPTILFLSYDLFAYSTETDENCNVVSMWNELRTETELALSSLAHEGYNVLVKPHPQQQAAEDEKRFQAYAGKEWKHRVQLLSPGVDIRHLMVNIDIAVGFQTTALLEAMIAQKPIVYTHWTDAVYRAAPGLIPYHDHGDILHIARSPADLVSLVRASTGAVIPAEVTQKRLALVEEHLGPIDGHSSERAWADVDAHMSAARKLSPMPAA
jgi:hypothetical protein